jgi:hypothetical protein
MEVWKKIPGYEEYEVSSLGKVRGQYGKILSPWKSKGYDIVWICKDTIKRKIGVHRLVAWAFLENPENKPTVDHLNRNRTDNRVENLKWATQSEQRLTSPVPISHTGERNINVTSCGKFRFVIKRNKCTLINKIYDTFEEAMEAKNAFILRE